MNREQYQEQITYIQHLVDEKKYDIAERNLEELYRYKPVRLAWYHLKGIVEMHMSEE